MNLKSIVTVALLLLCHIASAVIIQNGQTDVTTYFVLRDSTTHAPKTDVTVTNIDLYYVESGAAISSKIDATALDAANSSHTDGAAFNVGQGLYRIDWPDAAFDTGIGKTTTLIVVCSGVDTVYMDVDLSPPVNVVEWKGSTAPANTGDAYARLGAPAGASIAADLATIDDYVDTEVAAIKTKTDYLPSATAGSAGGLFIAGTNAATTITTALTANITGDLSGSVGSVTGNVGGNVAGSVGSVASGGITAASIAADAIGASELASDAVTEIQSGLATSSSITTLTGYVDTEVADIKAKTDNLSFTGTDVKATLDGETVTVSTNNDKTGYSLAVAPLDAAGVRAAVGLASANLDTQLDALPTAGEIADAVWDEVTSGHQTAGTTGKALTDAGAAGTPPTAGEIADAVWDESRSGHTTVGTFGHGVIVATNNDKTGYSLTTTPLDADGVRSAIGLASANLDTQLGTLATSSAMSAAFTEIKGTGWNSSTDTLRVIGGAVGGTGTNVNVVSVNGIPVASPSDFGPNMDDFATVQDLLDNFGTVNDTLSNFSTPTEIAEALWNDNLSDNNTQGSAATIMKYIGNGTGYIPVNYRLTLADGTPVADATVWVTTDSAGTNRIATSKTNANGYVSPPFMLNPGTVYIWRAKAGNTWNNPVTKLITAPGP